MEGLRRSPTTHGTDARDHEGHADAGGVPMDATYSPLHLHPHSPNFSNFRLFLLVILRVFQWSLPADVVVLPR